MSHLGFKILYKILNDDPRTLAERCYAPWVDMEARAPRARPAARLAGERAAAPRLRRRRLLAPVRAHVHERPQHARPRRHPAPLGAIAARTIRSSSPAGRRRRTPSRSRRSSTRSSSATARRRPTEVALTWARLRRAGVPRAERLVALAKLGGVYVPSLYATRVDADTGFAVVDRPLVAGRPVPRRALARRPRRSYPFPDDGPIGGPGGDLRPHVDRDRARLHRGLPLLPGGDDLPPGARARPGADRRDGALGREEVGARRGEPHLALDGGLLVHLAAREEGRATASRRSASRSASPRCARTASSPSCSTRSSTCARPALTFAPEAGHAADARRREQERHRRAAPSRRPSASSRAGGAR